MIHTYDYCKANIGEVGETVEVIDSYVRATGLPNAALGEGISFETGEHGQIVALNKDEVEILVLSRNMIRVGTKMARTDRQISVSVGEGLLSHTLDAFGYAKDERRFKSDFPEEREIITHAASRIDERRPVTRFMATGVSMIDLLIPVGWGQRELIIGDKKTGKTHFLLQSAITQAKMGRVVIYGSIGKRKEEVKAVEEFMQRNGIEERCIIVAADAYDSPGEIFLAPYTAMTIAEYFRDKGTDVLLILDDLTTHAKYYRELSLVGQRYPGRESYPGDVFYIHSRLLERAGSFSHKNGDATITCLPVAESLGGDITGYIQTNLMSMTDGHIFFDINDFLKGARPAVNVFLSVTRVGRQTQSPLMRDIGQKIMTTLKRYDNIQKFLNFGPELGEEAQKMINLGTSLSNFFNQLSYCVLLPNIQMFLVAYLWGGYWNGEGAVKFQKIYDQNLKFKETVDVMIEKSASLDQLATNVKVKSTNIANILTKYEKL